MSTAHATDRPRVLVVEDDATVLRLLHVVLSSVGDVVLAVDGLDAWQKLELGPVPALVVTDHMMPRMDGLALTRKMRGDTRFARVPVIVLTAKDSPHDAITGINAGARHYLTKPFKPDELLAKVESILRLPR